MNNKRFYIAYGSNLNKGQMEMRCPGAKAAGTAVIENYRLLFKGSGTGAYLTIEPAEGFRVPVAIWSVTAEDEARLDIYEGFPDFYYKTEMELNVTGFKNHKAKRLTAFVYIMHEERSLGIPTVEYLQICAAGYRDFSFDGAYLRDAYMLSRED